MGGYSSSDLHADESDSGAGGFGAPDGEHHHNHHHLLPLQIPPTSIESLATLLAETASTSSFTPAVHFYDPIANAPPPLMEIDTDHEEDTTSFLFSQLTAVSQRAMRTARRLARSGKGAGSTTTLMVSSPEVNEALEDTNTLINTVNDIMTAAAAAGRDDSMTATDYAGLAFLALACHQNLMTLFRAICDAIQSRLQARKEEREKQQQLLLLLQHPTRDNNNTNNNNSNGNSGVGPLNVAQFVMVLQLLMHLISRMGRFLVISPTTSEQDNQLLAPAAAMLDQCSSAMATDDYAIDLATGQSTGSSATPAHNHHHHHHSPRRSGLLEHVQEIVGNIPSERERLRLIIQELQTEMDHAELH